MGTLHLAVNVLPFHLEATPRDWLPARLVFYFMTLAPHDYLPRTEMAYMKDQPIKEELPVGVWPPVSSRQDMGRTIRGGLAHKIKTCTALLGVHRKTLYSTK